MASIKDVAAIANVSVATVSRVLSGKGPVRHELRERVTAAMHALDYRPNAAAQRLRSGHTSTVGLVVSDIRNPFFTELSRAVEDCAYQRGSRVLLCNTDEDPDKEAMYLRLMREERVAGVIYSPTRTALETFASNAFRFPVVMVDRAGAPHVADAVTIDNRAEAARLTQHLIARGCSRVAGVFGNASTTGDARRAGVVDALQAAGRRATLCHSAFLPPRPDAAQTRVASWLRADTPPDAVVASNGRLLLGAYRACRAWQESHDGAAPLLVGFDNEDWTALVEPPLTVLAQPVYEIGRHAMALLAERLAAPDSPRRTVVLAGELIVRDGNAA
ncbi:LacI family DNA-binding transcriptional regulator [Chitinasiproducens palmae]|uniref:Transcriptional regulator, LacI family n=1 Tax=Chitinasiproducens palmae TaxID=1770053 RepID=A0A1H2PK15_9BURK|nr:LacI family DNA-binding transcriptional regulator [Chitinasiproducens palmae]SDV46749.1 transcriptional regulator, LacI family [Chitinasiproducens palmae]